MYADMLRPYFELFPQSGFVLGAVSYLALTIWLLVSGLVGWTMMQIVDSPERGRGIESVVEEFDRPSPPRRMGE